MRKYESMQVHKCARWKCASTQMCKWASTCTSTQVCKYLRKYTSTQVHAQVCRYLHKYARVRKYANAQVRKCANTLQVRKYMCTSARNSASTERKYIRKCVCLQVLAQEHVQLGKYIHKCPICAST